MALTWVAPAACCCCFAPQPERSTVAESAKVSMSASGFLFFAKNKEITSFLVISDDTFPTFPYLLGLTLRLVNKCLLLTHLIV